MISPQDFERLSAYLDHQLSATEREQFEAQLAREPELQTALADLRRVSAAMRALPTVEPPRHFTLSAHQARDAVPQHAPGLSLSGRLRLASTAAALALVVMLIGERALPAAPTSVSYQAAAPLPAETALAQSPAPGAAQPDLQPTLTETIVADAYLSSTAEPPAIALAVGASAPTESALAPTAEAFALSPAATPSTESAAGGSVTSDYGTLPPTPSSMANKAAFPATVTPAATTADEASASRARPTTEAANTAQVASILEPTPTPPPQAPPSPLTGWRYAQMGLAGLALALAFAAWLVGRRQ